MDTMVGGQSPPLPVGQIIDGLGEQQAKDLLLTIVAQFPHTSKIIKEHAPAAGDTTVTVTATNGNGNGPQQSSSSDLHHNRSGASNGNSHGSDPVGNSNSNGSFERKESMPDGAEDDLDQRKLFIRGLPWVVTEKAVRKVFQEYGEIVECAICVDRITRRSRGYGFLTYKTVESAQLALRSPAKEIGGRTTQCNLACERSRKNRRNGNNQHGRRHNNNNNNNNQRGGSHQNNLASVAVEQVNSQMQSLTFRDDQDHRGGYDDHHNHMMPYGNGSNQPYPPGLHQSQQMMHAMQLHMDGRGSMPPQMQQAPYSGRGAGVTQLSMPQQQSHLRLPQQQSAVHQHQQQQSQAADALVRGNGFPTYAYAGNANMPGFSQQSFADHQMSSDDAQRQMSASLASFFPTSMGLGGNGFPGNSLQQPPAQQQQPQYHSGGGSDILLMKPDHSPIAAVVNPPSMVNSGFAPL